jgi:serine/threonine protein kinase
VTPDEWQRLKVVLDGALQQEAGNRAAYLQQACGGDAELLARAESLIVSAEEPWTGLDGPASGLADEGSESRIGERIGAYEIVEVIAHGGMGTVYLGRRADEEFRKKVAIKLVKRGMDTDFVLRRFRTERQILASVEHPNIARLLDGGVTGDGQPYFVMEYVEGQPLLDYCDTRRLSTTQRLSLFLDVCSAVQFAHQKLVVHRDLKPANILVTPEGMLKLLDFGIAKVLDPQIAAATLQQTASVLRLMTPDYASPEQVRGEPITTASDVYSLGVLLYELLTGHRPYRLTSVDPVEVARIVCDRDPEKPSTVVMREEEVPAPDGKCSIAVTPESVSRTREGEPRLLQRRLRGDLDNIVLTAMRKEPKERYASVEQLSQDIRRHLDGHPVIARKPTLGYRTGKFVRRNRVAAAAATLVLVSLLGGTGFSLREAAAARRERARAQRRFNDVRRLAGSFVFEFHDAIENLPGSTPARALVARRALEYLDSLSSEATGDRLLLRELAAAYRKVGDVQGALNGPNLGDSGAASRSYGKSLEICERLIADSHSDANDREQLVLALIAVSTSQIKSGELDCAEHNALRALEQAQTSVREDSGSVPAKKLLARAFSVLAFERWRARAYVEAADLYRQQQFIFEQLHWLAPTRQTELDLAYSGMAIGGALVYAGSFAGALQPLRVSSESLEELSRTNPSDTSAPLLLSNVFQFLGQAEAGLRHEQAAIQSFERAKALLDQLRVADGENVDLRLRLTEVYAYWGEYLISSERPAAGLALAERARDLAAELSAADPEDRDARSQIARMTYDIGWASEVLAGKVPRRERRKALRGVQSTYQKALEIWDEMSKTGSLALDDFDAREALIGRLSACNAELTRLGER